MYDTNVFGVHIIRSFPVGLHMIRIYPTNLILPIALQTHAKVKKKSYQYHEVTFLFGVFTHLHEIELIIL